VKWLAQGYTINDEACSHSLISPLIEIKIWGGAKRKAGIHAIFHPCN
jgi:hypothetical protein